MLSAIIYQGFICLGGIVPSSLGAMETCKRDLWSCQEMVCWWGLRLKFIRTRVGRPLLFCKQSPVKICKVPVVQFSLFSALQFLWRNPTVYFSFKFKIWNPIYIFFPSSSKFGIYIYIWLHCLQGILINLMFFNLVLSRIQGLLFHELRV